MSRLPLLEGIKPPENSQHPEIPSLSDRHQHSPGGPCTRAAAERVAFGEDSHHVPSAFTESGIADSLPMPASFIYDSSTNMTPASEYVPNFNVKTLDPVLSFTITTTTEFPHPKPLPNLRLPSFDALGIASPHPDRIGQIPEDLFAIGAGPSSKPEDPLHELSPTLAPCRLFPDTMSQESDNGGDDKSSIRHFVPTFTPPYDGTISWDPIPLVQAAVTSSPAQTEPDNQPNADQQPVSDPSDTSTTLAHLQRLGLGDDGLGNDLHWLADMVNKILTNLASIDDQRRTVLHILTHALPCPSAQGHIFPHIINAVNDSVSVSRNNTAQPQTVWISVYHAVPGRFNIADLPTSPPSTPGPAIGGEDYFATRVLDNAVPITDYQGDLKRLPSPQPVATPGTVNVSIVERYIPPTKPTEFAEMFSLEAKRSLLLDRLLELSPDHGTLLFIYPTDDGAKTFIEEYLNPVMEYLLRELTIVHRLPSGLAEQIARSDSVGRLLDFVRIRSNLEALCQKLNDPEYKLGRWGALRPAKYRLIHTSTQKVKLSRKVWAEDWWMKQEKERVREILRQLPATSAVSPGEMMHKFVDGMAHRKSQKEPKHGVEVCVFMIEKTAN